MQGNESSARERPQGGPVERRLELGELDPSADARRQEQPLAGARGRVEELRLAKRNLLVNRTQVPLRAG